MKPTLPYLTGAALLLAGCNLAPHYERPALETPAAFREAKSPDGITWTPADTSVPLARGTWWQLYGDPQLDELEQQVRISNENVRAAESSFRAARAAAVLARAAMLPSLTVNPAYTRSHASRTLQSSSGKTPSNDSPAAVDNFSVPFDLSYEFDLWGRIRNSAAAGRALAQASEADLAGAILSTQAAVAQDYFQLRAVDAQREILADAVASYRQSLDETRTLYRTGIDSEEDVARAETQLNTAIAQATDLGVARSGFEHALAVLMGKAPASFSLPSQPLTTQAPALPAGLPSDLLLRRPDIAAAERRAAAANAQIGIARAAWFPRLTLGAAAGWQSSSVAQLFDWPSRFWSIGPQLAAAVFDGGARRATTEQARAQFDEAAANYRQTVLSAFQSVEDNLAAQRILAQEASEQQRAVASSQHLLQLANTRFKLGIDSYLNVITAQTALLANRQAAVQIQLRTLLANVGLIKALGGGWSAAPAGQHGSPGAVSVTMPGAPASVGTVVSSP